ncbi:similar to Saccharomyces cerevisiae YIL078W THS1 Threonyl-tRNA synthetase, essential cytoplasmic protein [Maudiozyma barnettii]|uniref:Threonine--tRNA ligase, cytoplasmic n=1 Tax=Maudiozyma barnettii TaxID=61262 RepID=A0A8H2ZFD0_9SACH|nr:threonine--tRNA ligase THS1 [Kazachstania barnettii]CAB4252229.1 similar to Saccharomyces cerevisiae YIL078W THS1 Threonyl-tRNA synthetase, essential cytoplasmic protein [Kazachstania barnettii]CAD1778877.1 similar to Saccharomyces cerevisiae YIL078W THS1 Threonyl-tRNA synthetase, essential cytoplasmic protein [Kazachstania barnettii]
MSAAEATEQVKNLSVKEDKKQNKKQNNKQGKQALYMDPEPQFIEERIQLFEKLQKEYNDKCDAAPRNKLNIILKDGAVKEAKSFETTPLDIARDISKSLADRLCIAKVNGQLWDLDRPFEGEENEDIKLQLLDFDSDDGKRVFWHSSAHVLGEACECNMGAHICLGPPTDDGFFYEFSTRDSLKEITEEEKANERTISQADFPALESVSKNVIKDKQKFERLVMSKEDLLKMFHYSKYKTYLVQTKIPDGGATTVYRCGKLIDLCVGPHIPNTNRIKAFKLLKASSCYFLGDAENDSLQRVYGVSFPDKKLMTAHLQFLEEAKKRDHRRIGKEQELFMFNEMSPGSAFWLPHGTRIYNTLVDLMRTQYQKRGYEEVITPNMYNSKLWETSGHWANYKENMFSFEVEKETYGLKPMNCPGHCLMFKSRERSYRELPWRVADFGVIHRNEFSGALSGLTRVRRFQQDDAHIFCTQDQIESEIENIFDFLKYVYGVFGFEFKMELSTRPDKYVGEIETWDAAEAKLESALVKWGGNWEINPGDGAFYGPKIDIMISDALRRWHQCATIQLDFQLPNRFELEFKAKDNKTNSEETTVEAYDRPVMIHRAILGSVERMTAILTEHFAGKWPFWLSPRQVLVVPVGVKYQDYAQEVRDKFHSAGFYADVDLTGNTLQKKVRNGQMLKYNFIFIVGEQEMTENSVNIRNRDVMEQQGKNATVDVETVIKQLSNLKEEKRNDNTLI